MRFASQAQTTNRPLSKEEPWWMPIAFVRTVLWIVGGIISLSPRRMRNALLWFKSQYKLRAAKLDQEARDLRVKTLDYEALMGPGPASEGSLSAPVGEDDE